MTEIEKMKEYIQRTKIPNRNRYDIKYNEVCAINKALSNPTEAVPLAFWYGMAKGYRAAFGKQAGGSRN